MHKAGAVLLVALLILLVGGNWYLLNKSASLEQELVELRQQNQQLIIKQDRLVFENETLKEQAGPFATVIRGPKVGKPFLFVSPPWQGTKHTLIAAATDSELFVLELSDNQLAIRSRTPCIGVPTGLAIACLEHSTIMELIIGGIIGTKTGFIQIYNTEDMQLRPIWTKEIPQPISGMALLEIDNAYRLISSRPDGTFAYEYDHPGFTKESALDLPAGLIAAGNMTQTGQQIVLATEDGDQVAVYDYDGNQAIKVWSTTAPVGTYGSPVVALQITPTEHRQVFVRTFGQRYSAFRQIGQKYFPSTVSIPEDWNHFASGLIDGELRIVSAVDNWIEINLP